MTSTFQSPFISVSVGQNNIKYEECMNINMNKIFTHWQLFLPFLMSNTHIHELELNMTQKPLDSPWGPLLLCVCSVPSAQGTHSLSELCAPPCCLHEDNNHPRKPPQLRRHTNVGSYLQGWSTDRVWHRTSWRWTLTDTFLPVGASPLCWCFPFSLLLHSGNSVCLKNMPTYSQPRPPPQLWRQNTHPISNVTQFFHIVFFY